MKETRSARSRVRKTRLLTNNHECCDRCRVLLSVPEDEFHQGSYDLPNGDVLWHFPMEPHWWREEWSAKRRERVIVDFRLNDDLGSVVDLLRMTIDDELLSAEDVAQAIRLHASLAWLVDIGNQWFPRFQSDNPLEAMIEYWRLRHAETLLELAGRTILTAPTSLIAEGMNLALVRAFDIEGHHLVDHEIKRT